MQKAIKLRRAAFGHDHLDVAPVLLDHAFNQFRLGNVVAAEAETREALAICKTGGFKHEKTLVAYGLLTFFLGEQQNDAEALAVADQALAFAHDGDYEEHPELAKLLHNLVPLKIRAVRRHLRRRRLPR